MRFMSVIKLKSSCHGVKAYFSGTNSTAEHFSGQLTNSVRRTQLQWRSVPFTSLPKRHLVSNPVNDVSDTGIFRALLQSSRQFMATMSPSFGWRRVGGYAFPQRETGEGQMDAWARFQSFRQPEVLKILSCGKQTTPKSRYTVLPAVLVTLTDNKGQVLMRAVGLMLGGAYLWPVRPLPVAEHLHGQMALNSLKLQNDSLISQSVAIFCMTVETMSLALRTMYLLGLFLPFLILAPLADACGGQFRVYWLELLLATLEMAGPAFIKWGQWAATRPDVFPNDVCDRLSKLHMQAPSHSFQQTRRICEKAFKMKLEDIFEEFSEDPVASGSIAQVHRAVLKGQYKASGKSHYVAVKVRHPGVTRVIQQDFVIIKWLAKFSTALPGLRHLQLDKTVQQFASFMTKQVDLTLEAGHLLRFIYNFRKIRNVSFPVPIYPWVHPSVLVETFEEGQSIANFVDLSRGLTRTHSQLAYIGSSALLKMLLMDNFIHGDLHPGNIFVRFVGSRPNVVLLDVGMTAELNQRSRDILLELFKAVAEKDGRKVAEWTLQFSEDQTCPDPEGFARDVDVKFKEYLGQRGTPQNTGECMTELFDQVRKHRVNMDGDVCTVMVTTLVLEGWQRKLDPELDIIRLVGEMLFKREWAIPYDYTLSAIAAP